jgi:hypothetical protein
MIDVTMKVEYWDVEIISISRRDLDILTVQCGEQRIRVDYIIGMDHFLSRSIETQAIAEICLAFRDLP